LPGAGRGGRARGTAGPGDPAPGAAAADPTAGRRAVRGAGGAGRGSRPARLGNLTYMTVRLRPVLASLPAYVPGRTVPGAIKLASNENSYPPLPHVLDRIAEAAATINRYPDTNSSALAQALADRYGVAAEQVVVGCGSVSLCQQLVLATTGQDEQVMFGWRSFEAYPIITAIAG